MFLRKSCVAVTLLVIFLTFTFSAFKVSAASAKMAVEPVSRVVTVGETFQVNVTVADVANLTGWQFGLYFERAMLNCTNVAEGPFLTSSGGTYFLYQVNNTYSSTYGRALAACSFLGNVSVNGNGTLALLTFKAVGSGNATLHLTDTLLTDEKFPPKPISHTTIDGTVQVNSAPHNIAVTNITLGKTAIGQNYAGNINVTIENQGNYAETFNVSVYANLAEIATIKNVTLTNGMSTIITFTWNTSGFSKGNYTISASASPVQDETDTTDNNSTDGWILVTILGDVNGDFKCEGKDIAIIAKAYGSLTGQPAYVPNADVNGDGKIDGKDIAVAAKYYGTHYP